MNQCGLIEDDAHLYRLLNRIHEAVKRARPNTEMEEFYIMRKLPPAPGSPRMQLIRGVMPIGFNFYETRQDGVIRRHKSRTKKKRKIRKTLNSHAAG